MLCLLQRERYQRYVDVLREHLNALSPSHSMAIRIEPVIGTYRVDVGRLSVTTQGKTVGRADIVKEEPEAEARAEKAEEEDSEVESDESDISAGRCSYQEAILQSPGSHLKSN